MNDIGRVLVAIPVHNEEDTIAAVLKQVRQYYAGDILIINDGSTDRSVEIAEGQGISDLFIIRHEKNEGYGASLIDAFSFAITNGYQILITMDCDEQHEPCMIPGFIQRMSGSSADIISGSRYLREHSTDDAPPPERYAVNMAVRDEINRITGYGITDAFCGFKAYQVASLQRLEFDEPGYGFPLQVWVQARCNGLSVEEIPVARIYRHLDRSFGEQLDNLHSRLHYYQEIIAREVSKCRLISWQ